MKARLFLAAFGFLVLISMKAEQPNTTGEFIRSSSSGYYDEPIQFEERGIMFYVFLNGDFDFNTEPTVHVDYLFKRGNSHNQSYHAPRGIRIERDSQGRIRRIGNVFISYSFDNQVKRIGTVYIQYHRGRMEQIGNMRIIYGRYGVSFRGSVKGHYYSHNPYYSQNWTSLNNGHFVTWEYGYYDSFFSSNDFHQGYENYDEDDNFYYFRTKGNNKEGQIIKRKKENNSQKNESRRKM